MVRFNAKKLVTDNIKCTQKKKKSQGKNSWPPRTRFKNIQNNVTLTSSILATNINNKKMYTTFRRSHTAYKLTSQKYVA